MPLKYIFSCNDALKHLIAIEFVADAIQSNEVRIQLPSWRPGRYEQGNFAKNVKQFIPLDEKDRVLPFQKITKDCWVIHTKDIKQLRIKYFYYAVDLNAGSSFLDENQLYVNPVNCCVYIPDRIEEACIIELKIPSDYQVACSLPSATAHKKQENTSYKHILSAKDYHELADSPFIASPTIKHNVFFLDGIEFNLWFQGECKINWAKVLNDFFIFINEQFVTMKGPVPSSEYHFLFQILPYRFHHGVEHLASTVIALGPSYDIMDGEVFLELLSVSSHELFHSWNIKAIRPAEMFPYDYTKENYSRLGFVYEGVTTYYGDFLLFRSGIYSEVDYFKSMFRHLQAHFDNFGRYTMSVADSSFDTWLDGYAEIVPHRKTSIYSEGCLLALMTDLMIRRYTQNKQCLDDVMMYLYTEFAQKGKGYSETDYKQAVEKIATHSFEVFFNTYIYGATSYENALGECLKYVGLQLLKVKSKKYFEGAYGIKTSSPSNLQILKGMRGEIVTAIYPDSVIEKAGIQLGDEIISINGYTLKNNNLAEWAKYFGRSEIKLTVSGNGTTRPICFIPSAEEYFKTYYIHKIASAADSQKENFGLWCKRKW
jgi:predicted metalloprotease with PDZ domain